MIDLILFCFGTAALSHFLQLTFKKGMIFRQYYVIISLAFAYPKNNSKKWLYKVLGGCIYCNSTWVFIGLFLAKMLFDCRVSLDLVGLFLGIGINYFMVDLIGRVAHI